MIEQKIGGLTSYLTAKDMNEPFDAVVILAHGYGANGRDLLGLGQAWQTMCPNTLFISPDAPSQCAGAPFGFQWFPITDLSPAAMADNIQAAWPQLNDYVDAVQAEFDVDDAHTILCGFSQGTMMSLYTALSRPAPLAGVLGYSGVLLNDELADACPHKSMPIHLIHGDEDDVIPPDALNMSAQALTAAGFTHVKADLIKGLPHGIDDTGLNLGLKFILDAFGGQ